MKGRKRQKIKTGTKNRGNKQKTITNIMDNNSAISTMILNISGLNVPIRRQIVSTNQKKIRPNYMLATRNPI